ncbi:MAG: phosphoenolpyruvate carboxykinase (ATP) [Candidatus Stygibacter australis]|nr:phosphoenolpyruvate carboxykinase (ATP) [Candidatus Stygibacter australis]MDP8321671.1 phosphoenolpyruvate carboxykinase (ATP) [Candidatus Stygibacter australis]
MPYSKEQIAEELNHILGRHPRLIKNPSRKFMIKSAVDNGEAVISACGCLSTWTPPESTGRSPKDTYIVKRAASSDTIDWDSPNNVPMREETFDMILEDAYTALSRLDKLYLTDRVVGADSSFALPTRTVSDMALTVLFTDNMFRPVPENLNTCLEGFTLIALPYLKLDPKRYKGHLRVMADGTTSNMAVTMDFDRHIGIVYGSAYGGSVKKLMFTVMNYYMPAEGVLPLHCSANEGINGDSALLLGLSGTGKTTLSADPKRALLGDDEHGWSNYGIANFENGCYAKLINLRKDKEPEIHQAVFHEDHYLEHGSIVENTMMYPDGTYDLDDERLTPNSRGSYPLKYLSNIKESSCSDHPKTILFLTADANGVLPPVSRLTPEQAMLWFLMGYTSKLAGTETGIVDPVSTFSRFFGEPFMPRNPDVYAKMLGDKMEQFGTSVYLVNTGWSGGAYGEGSRMDINLTRAIVDACLEGSMESVEYEENDLFHVLIPKSCPGVDAEVLNPRNTWKNKSRYDERARKLASDFSNHFDKAYGNKDINASIAAQCPGK